MNKSLAPLIISFAVIILLTIIITNSKPAKDGIVETKIYELAPPMQLSPFSASPARKKKKDGAVGHYLSYPDSTEILEKAKEMLSKGKEEEAENELRTLLIFDPDNFSALSLLGGIFYYSQRYAEAEMIFRRQIKIEPENSTVYNRIGSTLAKQQKMEEAIEMTAKAAELNPNSAEVHINLAGMYSVIKNADSAIKHMLITYQLIGYRILPFSYDPSFDNIRSTPEFQEIIARAKKDWQIHINAGKSEPPVNK